MFEKNNPITALNTLYTKEKEKDVQLVFQNITQPVKNK